MKILFGSHYGKDTSELESGYLVWIIEKFEQADWTLIQACKQELSARLKIDFVPAPKEPDSGQLRAMNAELERERDFLLDVVMMSVQCRGNYYAVEGYLNNPNYMYQVMSMMKEVQN